MVDRIKKGHLTAPVHVVRTMVPKGDHIPMHFHPIQEEWYMMTEGNGMLTIGEESFQMELWEMYHLPPGTPHGVTTEDGVVFMSFGTNPTKEDVIFI